MASGVDELGVGADRGERADDDALKNGATPRDGEAPKEGASDGESVSDGTSTSDRGSRVSEAFKRLADRLGIGVLEATALRMWVLTRLSILIFVYSMTWVTQPKGKYGPKSFTMLWERWDWLRYQGIAEHGYVLGTRHGSPIAFFPGYPIMLRAVQTVVRSYVYSGLLISFVAGAIASVALTRIIAQEAERAFGTGEGALEKTRTAVREGTLLWLFTPAAFYLAAGYTEAPFLAFALPAWLCARRGRWMASGLLMAGASAIRINGVFLLAAVGILFLTQTKPRTLRELLRAAPLAISLVPVLAYFTYLHHRTGSWNAWHKAEVTGWNRHLTDPFHALTNTWQLAFGGRTLMANNAWEYQLEMIAMAVGVALLVWLLRKRRWAEATFVGASVVTLGTSYNYLSVPRELLLWWPLWAVLGVWTVRRPWIRTVYLCVSAPLMFTVAYLYTMALWSG